MHNRFNSSYKRCLLKQHVNFWLITTMERSCSSHSLLTWLKFFMTFQPTSEYCAVDQAAEYNNLTAITAFITASQCIKFGILTFSTKFWKICGFIFTSFLDIKFDPNIINNSFVSWLLKSCTGIDKYWAPKVFHSPWKERVKVMNSNQQPLISSRN